MLKVVLIGDSIRMGYEPIVREILTGKKVTPSGRDSSPPHPDPLPPVGERGEEVEVWGSKENYQGGRDLWVKRATPKSWS